jgi:hypothetical protein
VVTCPRRRHTKQPVVFYAREGDTIFFSTTADRLKARVRKDPRIPITVLDEGAPFRFARR